VVFSNTAFSSTSNHPSSSSNHHNQPATNLPDISTTQYDKGEQVAETVPSSDSWNSFQRDEFWSQQELQQQDADAERIERIEENYDYDSDVASATKPSSHHQHDIDQQPEPDDIERTETLGRFGDEVPPTHAVSSFSSYTDTVNENGGGDEPMDAAEGANADNLTTFHNEYENVRDDKAEYVRDDKAENVRDDEAEYVRDDEAENVRDDEAENVRDDEAEYVRDDKAENVRDDEAENVREDKAENVREDEAEYVRDDEAENVRDDKAENVRDDEAENVRDDEAEYVREDKAENVREDKAENEHYEYEHEATRGRNDDRLERVEYASGNEANFPERYENEATSSVPVSRGTASIVNIRRAPNADALANSRVATSPR
jgi:hypothetical protein